MRYEYDITILTGTSHQIRTTLNEWGAKGWENYQIIGAMAYFRRSIVEAPFQAVQKPKGLQK